MTKTKTLTLTTVDPTKNNLPTAFDKPKVIIGGAHMHRAQRYAHKDPAPYLPFPDDTTNITWEEIIYFFLATTLLVAVALLGWFMV